MNRNKHESKKGINYSGNKCVVCGWNEKDNNGRSLIHGAHVRPFDRINKSTDRHDNIIALCPNDHAKFDSGKLTINYENKYIIEFKNGEESTKGKIVGKIDHIRKGNLDYHNNKIFGIGIYRK